MKLKHSTQIALPIALLFSMVTLSCPADNRMETIVVTATRSEQTLASMTTNTDWVNEETLNLVSHTHISESMARMAGTWITRANGQEHLTAIRSPVLTGASGCGSYLMMQDSVPLRATGFCNVNALFEAGTEQAGRIEVIKGPGTALHGSNAMHGVIDVISPAIAATPETRLSLEAGSFDYYRIKLSHSGDASRLDLVGASDGGYKDDSGFAQQKASFQHRWQTSQLDITSRLSASNLNQETAGYITGFDAYKDADKRKANPNPEAFRDASSVRFQSQVNYQRNADTRIIVTPYLRYMEMSFLQHYLPGEPLEENGQHSIGLQSSWHHTASDRLSVISGLDLEFTRAFVEEFQTNPTESGSAFVRETIPVGWHYNYEVKANVASPFAQLQYQVSNNTRVTAGLRFDYVSFDYSNNMIAGRSRDDGTPCGFGGCRFNRPEDRSDQFTTWSPKLGISHLLADNHQLYLSLARGFRAPQASELYQLQNDQSVSRIDSEQLNSIELGLRGATELLSYDVSIYAMKKDNVIFRDSNRVNVDNGATRHEGFELTTTLHLSETVSFAVNGTYARHRYDFSQILSGIDIDGNDVDTAPRHMGSAQLAWHFMPGAQSELEWIHMGRYYEDPENLNSYEGHDYLNLRARAQLADRWNLSIRLINLTDVDYAERADYGFGEDRYFIGNPLSVFLTIEGIL